MNTQSLIDTPSQSIISQEPSPPPPSAPDIAISSPLDTGPDASYFHTHYVSRINAAISSGHHFIIGPIPSGVDADALTYLLAYPIPASRISIFVTIAEERLWGDKFRSLGVRVVIEGALPRERDAAMTRESTHDILRWRRVVEVRALYGQRWREGVVTGTELNWRRRRGFGVGDVVREEEVDIFRLEDEQRAVAEAEAGKVRREETRTKRGRGRRYLTC
ncbi:hypothetical protein AJ80_00306 [Polytolypa hystricis UAMH7299]|uniref:Uncharacterized protein n=1 Tax=Polytolypa hystricis (strain UAMH7299) TaxID=1447883 RepID=A0A2B7Z3W5_POLH7|nr:hypothetical protein AJ80_00306 [Polytolypa hystricis UAMH7299]